MKSKILILVTLLLVVGFSIQCATPESQSLDPGMTIYVVPPITDVKILPTSSISSSYIMDEISIVASPGEYEPASFVIHTLDDITSLQVEATELEGEGGSIPSDNIDIRLVKCWYQGGNDLSVGCYGRYLTPELLLKDDTLVRVEGEHNYLKLTSGDYIWISERDDTYSGRKIIPITDRPVRDSSTLQPVNIPEATNKQFWVTIKVPNGALAGLYTGSIELRTPAGLIRELQLQLRVLPIELSEPYLTYSIAYRGRLKEIGSISSEDKNEEQFRAEMENLLNHGIINPSVYDQGDSTTLGEVLTIRNEAGMGGQPLCKFGGTEGRGYEDFINFVESSYGVTEVYLFAYDEPKPDNIDDIMEFCDSVHAAGGKTFASINKQLGEDLTKSLTPFLDVAVLTKGACTVSVAEAYHSYGHQVFSYDNPQVAPEFPETFRRNYGLWLWQSDYDGAMDYAYQASFDDIWNDFDSGEIRDHVFAYPTMDSVIDTIQWEGWREAVDDVRYLTTLLELIEEARGSKDTSTVESWLADLKNSDLTKKDLDAVRWEMIDHILYLLEPTIAYDPSSFTFNGIEGGANQDDQTLTIWNSSGGTLDWSVSDDTPWLTLDPASGTSTVETDDVTISVDITGMSAGSYSATITISAPGATNTPQTVPAILNINPAPRPGGGGGGGGAPPQQPKLELDMMGRVASGYITPDGVLGETIDVTSRDAVVRLCLPEGTMALDSEGNRLEEITVDPVSEPPALPEKWYVIGMAYDFWLDRACFDPSIELTIGCDPKELPERVNEGDIVIAYYSSDSGEWRLLEPSVVDTGAHTVTGSIGHFTCFAIIGREEAAFDFANLSISPSMVDSGESVTISVEVTNSGGMEGSYSVRLLIDREEEATQELTLGPGASDTVTLTVTRERAGIYSVEQVPTV